MQNDMGRSGNTNKELAWHANNMEIITAETANNREYKYIYAIAIAVLYILKKIERSRR